MWDDRENSLVSSDASQQQIAMLGVSLFSALHNVVVRLCRPPINKENIVVFNARPSSSFPTPDAPHYLDRGCTLCFRVQDFEETKFTLRGRSQEAMVDWVCEIKEMGRAGMLAVSDSGKQK